MQTEIVAADVTLWWIGKVDADVFAAWGQVGGAIATFMAAVVAVWIAIRDGRKAGQEAEIAEAERGRAELERARAEHDREQAERERNSRDTRNARLVFPEVAWGVYGKGGAGILTVGFTVRIENLGDDVVLKQNLEALDIHDRKNDRYGTFMITAGALRSSQVIQPKENKLWLKGDVMWPDERDFEKDQITMSIRFNFMDSLGRRWVRTDDSEPVLMRAREPLSYDELS